MKKFTLITAIFLSYSSIGRAQDTSSETDHRENFQFGLKAGANLSNVYDAKGEEFEADAKLGFVGGVFLAIPIGTYLGIQPEVLFSQKGFHAKGLILGSAYDFTRTTSFLDIPLQLAIKPSEFITLLVGPQYSYLLKKRDVFENAITTIEQEQEFENDNLRKNILGVIVGLDINLKHIAVGGRVAWDVQNNIGDGTATTPRYKNVWFQLTLGYKLY